MERPGGTIRRRTVDLTRSERVHPTSANPFLSRRASREQPSPFHTTVSRSVSSASPLVSRADPLPPPRCLVSPELRSWQAVLALQEPIRAIPFTSPVLARSTGLLPLVWEPQCGSLYAWPVKGSLQHMLIPVQLFYRARQDLPVLLGLRHPWEH